MELADLCTDPPLQGLLAMPAAWMQQLAEALDPTARLSLFQTCSAMRDVMLAARGVTLRFQRHLMQDRPDAAAASLALACTHSLNVKLVLIGNCSAPVDINVSACSLMLGARAAAGAGLQAICSTQLEGLVLDALVPSWLTSTCLHMTSLHLRHCHFTSLPATTTSIPTCSQLQQLHLHCPPDLTQDPALAQWQHQFNALTGLNSLSVHSTVPLILKPDWLQCCAAMGSQLTELSVSRMAVTAGLPLEFGIWFPSLIKIDLAPGFTVRDSDLKVLLSISTLRSLQCGGFMLREDHSHRPCPWTHLGVAHLNIGQLAGLPSKCLESVKANLGPRSEVGPGLLLDIYTHQDARGTGRVVEAINRCGGLQLGGVTEVFLDGNDEPADIPSLASALALLSNSQVRRFTLAGVLPVTAEVLAAMAQHLAIPSLTTIAFYGHHLDDSTFADDAWSLVLSRLPPQVKTVRLELPPDHMFESDLTEMCVHACRPVVLVVKRGTFGPRWWPMWKPRVRAAMAAAGHQHVTLKSSVEGEDESEDESEDGSEDESEDGSEEESEKDGSEDKSEC